MTDEPVTHKLRDLKMEGKMSIFWPIKRVSLEEIKKMYPSVKKTVKVKFSNVTLFK